jgi:uncharacterized membrane protein
VAALVHASALLTLVLGALGGVGAVLGLAVAPVVYLSYKERSRFVAFHALQSAVYQIGGLSVYLIVVAVLAVWSVLAWVGSGILTTVQIGVLFIPLAALGTAMTALVLVGMPLLLAVYAMYAAYQVYQGQDYRYWLIGDRLAREVKQ